MAQVGEIYVKLGIDGKKFDQGISDAKKKLALFAAEITATVYLIDRFAERSTNAATRMTNMAAASGIAASKLRQMGLAAQLGNAGTTAEEASKQLAEFGKNLYSLSRWGEGNAEGFNKLQTLGRGISFYGKETADIIAEISKSLKGLDDQEATNVLGAFGLSPEMLSFMRNYESLMNQANNNFGRSDEEIAQLEHADKIISNIKLNWSYLQDNIVLSVSPLLERLSTGLDNVRKDGFVPTVKRRIKEDFSSLVTSGKNAQYLMDMRNELISKGKTPEQADAIVNGMQQQGNAESAGGTGKWQPYHIRAAIRRLKEESGLKSDAYGTGEEAQGGRLEAYGAAQWQPSRQRDFAEWAGHSIKDSTLAEQIRFINHELTDGKEQSAGASFFGAKTEQEAYKSFTNDYERPSQKVGDVNMTNTFHVQGDNAETTASVIGSQLERQFKQALADQNNGAR